MRFTDSIEGERYPTSHNEVSGTRRDLRTTRASPMLSAGRSRRGVSYARFEETELTLFLIRASHYIRFVSIQQTRCIFYSTFRLTARLSHKFDTRVGSSKSESC